MLLEHPKFLILVVVKISSLSYCLFIFYSPIKYMNNTVSYAVKKRKKLKQKCNRVEKLRF